MLANLLNSTAKRVVAGVAAGLLVVGGVTFAATRGSDAKAAAPTTTEATTTTTEAPTTTAPQPIAPLTGQVGDPARIARPALVVKIDNVEPKARPQVGINEADVVYEERVEGSVTRLLAVFHSSDSVPVGPVRSARSSDIGIISALHRPFFAWSGANATFAERVRGANIVDVGYDALSGEYFREPTRRAPDNLMLKSTATVQALPADGSAPPPALFEYRASGQQTAHVEPAEGVRVTYGAAAGGAPVEYRWNGAGWARTQAGTPHVDVGGNQVAPPNVVIQFTPYASSGVTDQLGQFIPEAQTVGEGDAWILTGGGLSPHGLVQAHWSKPSLDAVTTYTDVDGNPVLLNPGRTWVALPAPGDATRL